MTIDLTTREIVALLDRELDGSDRAIATLEAAIETVASSDDLPDPEPRTIILGRLQLLAGDAYCDRLNGDPIENVESALASYEAAGVNLDPKTEPTQWARLHIAMGRAYRKRICGNRTKNAERALKHCENALTVLTRDAQPNDWAKAQFNLASVYRIRIRGDHAENLESAIGCCEAALTVQSKEASPIDWAKTQLCLGIAYRIRIREDRAENLERAIRFCKAALTVQIKEASPIDWAKTQLCLAIAYRIRIRGDRTENRERAMDCCEAALTVQNPDSLPFDWAATQNSLGLVYFDRIRGDRAENLERAINCYEAALTVRTKETLPEAWAVTKSNLATAYLNRIRGEMSENMERAISCCESALAVRTQETLPAGWALLQLNLAVVYRDRIRGDRAENLERAIACCESALTVHTRKELPFDWAITQDILGTIYRKRIRGDRAANLERAIKCCTYASEIRTKSVLPIEWATTKHNLALTYLERNKGSASDNIARAIECQLAALAVRTAETLPEDNLATLCLLARTYLEAGKWSNTITTTKTGRATYHLLLGESLDDLAIRNLIGTVGALFADGAYAALELGETDRALELASEGRARLLALAIRLQAIEMDLADRNRADKLREEIRNNERLLESTGGLERGAILDRLIAPRTELNTILRDAEMSRPPSVPANEQLLSLVPTGGAIALSIVTDVGGKILVATGAGIVVVDCPDLKSRRLHDMLKGDLRTGEQGWIDKLQSPIENHGTATPARLAAIDEIGGTLGALFGRALDHALRKLGVQHGSRIVWLPSQGLGGVPLGLAETSTSGEGFIDRYEMTYALSLESLERAQMRARAARDRSLTAVLNPTRDLPFTSTEAASLDRHFDSSCTKRLDAQSGDPSTVLDALGLASYWHFSCHGEFDPENARNASLVLKDGARLTVGDLLDAQGIAAPRLVVLSACETGLHDLEQTPDEFIGLPGAFTTLGAAGVLGTLWRVDDRATSLLVSRFYELHLGDDLAPAGALRAAQFWLRNSNAAKLEAYEAELRETPAFDVDLAEPAKTVLAASPSRFVGLIDGDQKSNAPSPPPSEGKHFDYRPYSHPYYWGGFVLTGL